MNQLTTTGLNLKPGKEVLRRDLHAALGGQTQSGISPSARRPIIMIFSDPASGEQYGYFDGPQPDGTFHYSGEGQSGDQVMARGNKAIRDHAAEGRELHLFLGNGKGKPVTYAGQFEYVDHYVTDAPEINNGPLRSVFMFRLRPVEAMPMPSRSNSISPAGETTFENVPVEQHLTEKIVLEPARELIEAERREAALVKKYKIFAESQRRELVRIRIRPKGEAKPLFTDLYEPASNLLIEAKGTVTREAIRMAVGQLLDYARFITPKPQLAVLVPSPLRSDLRELLNQNNIGVIEDTGGGFSEYLA
jgi:hypothetical protein